jgi:hypothetical protein
MDSVADSPLCRERPFGFKVRALWSRVAGMASLAFLRERRSKGHCLTEATLPFGR